MHTTYLRKVGSSIMLALPPNVLEKINLSAGSAVRVSIEQGRIMIEPSIARYTLNDLLAQCDPEAPVNTEDHGWLNDGPMGGELL
ncbi:MAG: antitoxin [Candidatus Adiutrix sp.]|jgi:antitoxin ChpS|nr:antitoxin [Candidatus Adiutrix sp.]